MNGENAVLTFASNLFPWNNNFFKGWGQTPLFSVYAAPVSVHEVAPLTTGLIYYLSLCLMTIFGAFNMPWYGLQCFIIIYYSTHEVIAYHLIQIGLSQQKGAKILMQE